MAQSLATETDLISNTEITGPGLRDYFLTLINANDRRYSERTIRIQAEVDFEKATVRDLIEALDEKDQQRSVQNHTLIVTVEGRIDQRFVALEHVKRVEFADLERQAVAVHDADKEYLATRLEALQRESALGLSSVKESIALALSAAKEAVNKAETANEKRFDGVNEFRATLADQQRLLIPRMEVDVIIKALEGKIATLNSAVADHNTRILSISVASANKSEGLTQGWGWAVGVIGLVLTLLSIVGVFVTFNSHKDMPAPVYQVAAPASPVYQLSPPASVQSK
jgi:hypothetical protein